MNIHKYLQSQENGCLDCKIRPGYRALQLVQNPIVADKNSPYVIVKTEINKKTNCSKQIN